MTTSRGAAPGKAAAPNQNSSAISKVAEPADMCFLCLRHPVEVHYQRLGWCRFCVARFIDRPSRRGWTELPV